MEGLGFAVFERQRPSSIFKIRSESGSPLDERLQKNPGHRFVARRPDWLMGKKRVAYPYDLSHKQGEAIELSIGLPIPSRGLEVATDPVQGPLDIPFLAAG